MTGSSNLEAVSPKPAFEPSELIDHGDASDLTRSGTSGATDTIDGYDS